MCRHNDIYVDPNSNDILELGTFEHPYKHIMMPFVEIFNFHSNSDEDITIHVIEEMEIEIPVDQIYLINITQVSITTFSRLNLEPSMSTFVESDTPYTLEDLKSLFRTMSDTSMDI